MNYQAGLGVISWPLASSCALIPTGDKLPLLNSEQNLAPSLYGYTNTLLQAPSLLRLLVLSGHTQLRAEPQLTRSVPQVDKATFFPIVF